MATIFSFVSFCLSGFICVLLKIFIDIYWFCLVFSFLVPENTIVLDAVPYIKPHSTDSTISSLVITPLKVSYPRNFVLAVGLDG